MPARVTIAAHSMVAVAGLLLPAVAPGQEKAADSPKVRRAAEAPAWVQEHPVNRDAKAPENSTHGDTYFLLADRQVNAKESHRYYHYAYRLLSENGVQENSQLSFDFDPVYETLTIHQLRVHRNGEVVDKLADQEFKVLQRETGHERQLYDGRLSAVALLEDVRIGDIVEYAYSLKGENPVFEGHYSYTDSTRWGSPVHQSRFRMLWEEDRPMEMRTHRMSVEPVTRDDGEFREVILREDDVAPILSDDGLPSYYFPRPWMEFSDYGSWQDVAEWAARQYESDEALPAELEREIERIRQIEGDEEQILAALKWTQDEIRYLGLFEGMHSHKPYDLETILRRRFGDCKDKSMTLARMLRELGFEADLALVGTGFRHKVADWLPSPDSFNHLIVHLRFRDRDFWLDATRSFERGTLEDRYVPAYGYALVVSDETTDLTKVIATGQGTSRTEILEEFDMEDYTGRALLTVTSTYYGRQANSMRSRFSSDSLDSIQKEYINHYSIEYPSIETAEAIRFEDDKEANVFTSIETYHIEDIWAPNEDEDDSIVIEFYARIVASEMNKPSTRIRTMPYDVSHPRNVTQRIVANFPTPLNLESDVTVVEDPAFELNFEEIGSPKRLELVYHYQSLADHIDAAATPKYIENIESAADLLGYLVWVPDSFAESTVAEILAEGDAAAAEVYEEASWLPNVTLTVVSLMALVISAGVCTALYFWNPQPMRPPRSPNSRLEGLEGWLVLLAISLVLGPPAAFFQWVTTMVVWDLDSWLEVADPDSERYHFLWQPTLMLEVILQCGFLVFDGFLLVLFFTRRASFPRLMAAYFPIRALSCFMIAGLYSVVSTFDQEDLPSYFSTATAALVATLIWVPYVLIARRVRLTFTRRRLGHQAHRAQHPAPAGSIAQAGPPPLPRTFTPRPEG